MDNITKKLLALIILIPFFIPIVGCDSKEQKTNNGENSLHFSSVSKCVFAINPHGVKYNLSINGLPVEYQETETLINGIPHRTFKKGRNKIKIVFEKNQDAKSLQDPYLNFNVGKLLNDRQSSKRLFNKDIQLNKKSRKTFEFEIHVDESPPHVWKEALKIHQITEKDRTQILELFNEYCKYIKSKDMNNFKSLMSLPRTHRKNVSNFREKSVEKAMNQYEEGIKEIMSFKEKAQVQCLDNNQLHLHKSSRGVLIDRKTDSPDSEDWILKVGELKVGEEKGQFKLHNLVCVKIDGSWKILFDR